MTTCLGCVLIYYDFIFVVRDYVSSSFAMDDLFGTDAELGVWQTPAEHEAIIDVSTTRNRLTSTSNFPGKRCCLHSSSSILSVES